MLIFTKNDPIVRKNQNLARPRLQENFKNVIKCRYGKSQGLRTTWQLNLINNNNLMGLIVWILNSTQYQYQPKPTDVGWAYLNKTKSQSALFGSTEGSSLNQHRFWLARVELGFGWSTFKNVCINVWLMNVHKKCVNHFFFFIEWSILG